MRLWRADNPEVAMNLIPWFVPTNQNPIQMGWELHERLKEKPEDTFCLVALRGRIVQAVLIAYKKGAEFISGRPTPVMPSDIQG